MSAPLPFTWDGEAMRVRPSFRRRADEAFCIGESYLMAPVEERSQASHRHYFSCIREAWASLPEDMAARFPTEDSLRAYALCKAGFCDVETFVASSKAEAQRLAAFVNKGQVLVTVSGATVTRLTPHSQSMRAMGAKAFHDSKAAVLDVIADLIGVEPQDLRSAA